MLKLREINLSQDDFEDLIDELYNTDGYMSFIKIYNRNLKKELLKNGLIIDHSFDKCSASDKLKDEQFSYNDIFKMLTNRSFKQLDRYEARVYKLNKLKTLFELANEFKYKLIKE